MSKSLIIGKTIWMLNGISGGGVGQRKPSYKKLYDTPLL